MAENADFNIGDVVQLKSGGPEMTVAAFVKDTSLVVCVWFNNNNDAQEFRFFPEALKAVSVKKPSKQLRNSR